MDAKLIEQCAKALWNDFINDPANQWKIFKIYGFVSWENLNGMDFIPNVANQFRHKAEIVIREVFLYKPEVRYPNGVKS